MYSESRKLHLIDEVLKIDNEAMLSKLESVLKKPSGLKKKKASFKDFSGIWSTKEANEISQIIQQSCEKINPEDWK